MDSTQAIPSATARALGIPEIVAFIVGNNNLPRDDLASLSQVCYYMFDVATPFLWKNATPEGLLWLIKSTEIDYRRNGRVHTIRLDAHMEEPNPFEDFHKYAQHVKTLEIYDRNCRPCYTVEGWDILRAERERNRPLLPNLRAVRFFNTSQSHGTDEFNWLIAFAHPGLEEVSLIPNPLLPAGRIPFPVSSLILATLVKMSPRIQVLELASNDDIFYPDNLSSARFDEPSFNGALRYRYPGSPTWYQSLPTLSHLRHLTLSDGWFHPNGLESIGRLAELESLTVVPGSLEGFEFKVDINSTVPECAFPGLINLSLIGFEVLRIGPVLTIAGMLRRLVTIKLEFYFDPHDVNDRYIELENIFKALRNAPHLQKLRVDCTFEPKAGERPANVRSAMEQMGLHPALENIYLSGIRIDKHWRRSRFLCIRDLGPIWPNVRILSMPHQSASISELEDFATLPSLTHLTLNLDLKHPYIPAKPNFKRAPLKVLTSSGPVRLSTDYEDISLCAVALLRLWPSLTCATWSDDDSARKELAEFFNSKILKCVKKSRFGQPQADAKLSARKRLKGFKVHFEQIVEDLEETDGWNSDSDRESEWETDSEVEPDSGLEL
ncbi:Clustered mitochondria protein homolog [Rhizoctonia solani]|uniref:Clustered mitochondria protein homolog n=1 Tax=Rhizoctonia solani TaxID=456999 RepID=A0A0K6GCI1_9AGAM|nr:Clustered mitochondria protein homolog [Rhizoctonia solani]